MTLYRPYTLFDYKTVVNLKLRTADEDEVFAATGMGANEAIDASIRASKEVWVVVHNGDIEAVFGVALTHDEDGIIGVPWFVATDKFNEFKISFAKESKKFVSGLLEKYRLLTNFVDVRNEAALRWLTWLGFNFADTITTSDGYKFVQFIMERNE